MRLQVPLGQSKKDAGLRQKELLGSGKASLARGLITAASAAAAELLCGKNSGDLLIEILRGGANGERAQIQARHISSAAYCGDCLI